MKRSRALYFHPKVNEGKIRALEALHVEYLRYLQACVEVMISSMRMSVSRKELLRFFPKEKVLSTNIVMACQQHAAEIVSGWTTSLYTRKLKRHIKNLAKEGEITEATQIALFTVGKYGVDRPSETIPQEAIDQYWSFLLDESLVGRTPTISNRVGMRMSIHTSDIRVVPEVDLTTWWLGISHLRKSHRLWVPIVANPHIKDPSEIVNGCMIRKDRRGRWRVEVLERKLIEDPKLDLTSPRVGVDVGLNVIAATSTGKLYGADLKPKFDTLYAKVKTLRGNRQRQGLRLNSPRLDRLEERLSGLIKSSTGFVANSLVRDYPGHAFVIEDLDLSGCRGQKRFAYRALHNSLKTKAPIIVVNPAYSSQECPSCGYVHRGNRSGTKFKCRGCGKISHADVVGGKNLLRRSEDNLILLDDSPSEVKTILRERYLDLRAGVSSSGRSATVLAASSRRLTTRVNSPGNAGTALNAEDPAMGQA